MIKFSRDINISNEFRISKYEAFIAYAIGIGIFYVNFGLLFVDPSISFELKIAFGVLMVAWTFLNMMLYCEKTKPLLMMPMDIDDDLLYSGVTEHTSEKLISEAEKISEISSAVDLMDF